MRRSIDFCYFTLFIFRYYVTSADIMKSVTYKTVMSSDGKATCSVNQPTTVLTMTGTDSSMRCAVECATSSCCFMYQLKASAATCELFAYMPTNFTVVSDCTAGFIDSKPCPAGFTRAGCSCLKLIPDMWTWSTADVNCRSLYPPLSHLVVIQDNTKQLEVSSIIGSYTSLWSSGQRISLTPTKTDFVWKPFPGVNMPLTYQNWVTGEPNFGGSNEFCLVIKPYGQWNDGGCGASISSICEVDYPP